MPTTNVSDITVNYLVEGPSDGETIVLINGLADDLESWGTQVPAFLEAGYRVLRYDNRGVGRTTRPKRPYTAELLASDLHGLLLNLGLTKFHLMGVSMGGMIAQSYALRYPNGSAAAKGCEMFTLSLCCTYSEPSIFCKRMFALWAEMAARMSVQDVMRDVTLWAFTVGFFRTRTKELEEVEEAMRNLDMPLEAYLAQLNVIQKFDTTSDLRQLKSDGSRLGGLKEGKCLVLAGEDDILIPVQLSKELAEMVPGAEFITTEGGHGCMWEFPDQFNSIFLEYLQKQKV